MNVFEQIESDDTIPVQVKEEMLSSLDTVKLVADVIDLFFVKGGQVAIRGIGPGNDREVDSTSPTASG